MSKRGLSHVCGVAVPFLPVKKEGEGFELKQSKLLVHPVVSEKTVHFMEGKEEERDEKKANRINDSRWIRHERYL